MSTILGQDLIIQRAYEELNKFNWSPEELTSYEAVIKRELDHQAILAKQYNEGKAEGKAEGRLEAAKGMLDEGLALELISKITRLSTAEINQLLK